MNNQLTDEEREDVEALEVASVLMRLASHVPEYKDLNLESSAQKLDAAIARRNIE